MNKKLLIILIISAVIGGTLWQASTSHLASATIFDDFLKLFKDNLITPQTTPSPILTPPPSNEQDKNKKTESSALYKPAFDYEDAVVEAVDKASPSVVSIVITKDLPIIENCPYNPFGDLPPEFRDFFGRDSGFEFSRPCQKGTEKKEVGGGSGFIISQDGMIITNKHVVLDEKAEYTVLTNEGKKYDAKVLARDPVQDIAVIKISADNLKTAKLGNSDTIKLGQTAIVIGNALGEFRNTVSVGVISGLARSIVAGGDGFTEKIEGVIQTDAAINQGNSGGPLLNLRGEVIGINVAMASGAQNVGFAIPINQVKRDIQSVKETGNIKVPFLGVRYISITPDIAKKQNLLVEYGAIVRGNEEGPAVLADSPAEKAGILAEDIILEVQGEKIQESKSLGGLIQKYNVGQTINLKIQRGEKILELKVTLAERPTM